MQWPCRQTLVRDSSSTDTRRNPNTGPVRSPICSQVLHGNAKGTYGLLPLVLRGQHVTQVGPDVIGFWCEIERPPIRDRRAIEIPLLFEG